MKLKNRKKNARLALWKKEPPICTNCGHPGSHYVMPCMGEEGYFICGSVYLEHGKPVKNR